MELVVERNSGAPTPELAVSAASTVAMDGAEFLHVEHCKSYDSFSLNHVSFFRCDQTELPGIANAMSMCRCVV